MARDWCLLAAQRAGDPPIARAQLAAGPRPAATLLSEGMEHGWGRHTLHSARQRAQIDARLIGYGAGGQWYWQVHHAPLQDGSTPTESTAENASSEAPGISELSELSRNNSTLVGSPVEETETSEIPVTTAIPIAGKAPSPGIFPESSESSENSLACGNQGTGISAPANMARTEAGE
jgi:hypothetical protein